MKTEKDFKRETAIANLHDEDFAQNLVDMYESKLNESENLLKNKHLLSYLSKEIAISVVEQMENMATMLPYGMLYVNIINRLEQIKDEIKGL